jgi:hypothetical protein
MLTYKIPSRPTAGRVYVWRKLRRLGAVLLHDAAWVLPATPQTREQFQWLAAEIAELGGEASLWESHLVLGGGEKLVQSFLAEVHAEYDEILADLARKSPDLAALSRRYQQVRAQDYFRSPKGEKVRKALLSSRGGPKQ